MRGWLDWMMRKQAQACPVALAAKGRRKLSMVKESPLLTRLPPKPSLLYHCLVHQQDRYVVAHRIHPPTLGTFQALAVCFLQQRLLANWANQYFEKIRRNHARILRQINLGDDAGTHHQRRVTDDDTSRLDFFPQPA